MKRLCVFYKHANKWQGKPVEWIVCKACQRQIALGRLLPLLRKANNESLVVPEPLRHTPGVEPGYRPHKRMR